MPLVDILKNLNSNLKTVNNEGGDNHCYIIDKYLYTFPKKLNKDSKYTCINLVKEDQNSKIRTLANKINNLKEAIEDGTNNNLNKWYNGDVSNNASKDLNKTIENFKNANTENLKDVSKITGLSDLLNSENEVTYKDSIEYNGKIYLIPEELDKGKICELDFNRGKKNKIDLSILNNKLENLKFPNKQSGSWYKKMMYVIPGEWDPEEFKDNDNLRINIDYKLKKGFIVPTLDKEATDEEKKKKIFTFYTNLDKAHTQKKIDELDGNVNNGKKQNILKVLE